MKKTVLALAAIAASSAAFAQSSVTLYGVVDASVESVKGNNTVTRVSSDNLASSRIAFKGVEDLGGGLKATFLLDAAVAVDTGAQGSTLFGRSAYVGLTGGFGEVRLGRQDSLIGAQTAGTIGTQGYDEAKIASTLGGDSLRRLDNAITYIAPTFVPGLTLAAQFSTGYNDASGFTTENGGNDGRTYGFSAAYANGPLSAGLSYIKANTDVAGDVENTGVFVYGAYDFGVAKLTAYYNTDDRDTAAGQQYDDRNMYGFKVAVPVAANVTLTGGYAQVRGAKGSGNAVPGSFVAKNTQDDKANILTVRAQYDLSKRTALYALYTQVNNDNNTNLSVASVATANDKSSRGIAVGVRHSF